MITIMYDDNTMDESFLYHAELPADEIISVVVAETEQEKREMQLDIRESPVVVVTVDKQQVIFAGREALSYLYRA